MLADLVLPAPRNPRDLPDPSWRSRDRVVALPRQFPAKLRGYRRPASHVFLTTRPRACRVELGRGAASPAPRLVPVEDPTDHVAEVRAEQRSRAARSAASMLVTLAVIVGASLAAVIR